MISKTLVDNTNEHSVATRMRRRRFQLLLGMLGELEGPISILDVGGKQQYWEMMVGDASVRDRLRVTLVNVAPEPVSLPGFRSVVGDGRAMPQFGEHEFDIVFSNSTIEHVGGFEDQRRMAAEVRRIGRRYYVQTPNRYFLIEPHYMFPLFQFLPLTMRAWLLQHFDLGCTAREPDRQRALAEVAGIRLLSRSEVERLFPDATIFEERALGMVKSFVAYTPKAVST